MKQLTAKHVDRNYSLPSISTLLDKADKNLLEYTPWKEYLYKPTVYFAIAYSVDAIFLKFYVDEKCIRAVNWETNAPVYEDACVEFFICFGNEEGYYNIEFNCIGAATVGFGKERCNRTLLSEDLIKEIHYQSIISNNKDDDTVHWELTLSIPLKVFCFHQLTGLKGKQCQANFTKCGDKLPQPHFVTWTDIQSPEPNFHLREFFGSLNFI